MSLENLPPIHKSWTAQYINDLTTKELELLYACLVRKLYQIEIRYEEHTVFYERNKDNAFLDLLEKKQKQSKLKN